MAQSPPDNEGRRLTSAGQEYVPNLCSTLPYLQELILSDNSISGGLPGIFADESSCLPQLRALNVESNQLTGALPRWLVERAELGYTAQDSGGDGGLRTLHLGDNLFDDPREEANRQRVTPLLLACNRLDIDCTGLPPNSCTAFGPRYEVAVEGGVCVRCPSEAERVLLALLVVFAMAVLMALALLFARLVRKYRSRVRHMTTALIIVNHVQNLALIGAMRLEWPEVLVEIYAALRLDVLPYLHVECFTRASDANTQQTIAWLASYAGCLLMLLVLGAWWPIRSLAKPIKWSDDMIEDYTPDKYDSKAISKQKEERLHTTLRKRLARKVSTGSNFAPRSSPTRRCWRASRPPSTLSSPPTAPPFSRRPGRPVLCWRSATYRSCSKLRRMNGSTGLSWFRRRRRSSASAF